MTDFKPGDEVVVRPEVARYRRWWTEGKIYTLDCEFAVRDDEQTAWTVAWYPGLFLPAPAPDADGWYPMPKLKAGAPIPEWLVDLETWYRTTEGHEWSGLATQMHRLFDGTLTHYRPAPQTEIATTPDGKEYRITHGPDGSVKAEVV